MPIALPSADEVRDLHAFIQDRNEEEWQAAQTDESLSEERFETIRRLSNCTKLGIASNAAALLIALQEGALGCAETYWGNLAICGEQWQEHPDWRQVWAHPARAALRNP